MRRLSALVLALSLCVGTAVAQPPPGYAPIPPPRHETMPPPRGEHFVWQPGHWHWTGGAYVWNPGHYIERRPHHHRWIDGHWAWSPRFGRHQWVPGHWD